ncbi:MAG TPA: pitrilysin family protein [Gemmatimonadales bacterium]|nr:pitrilysin family protein [Gemmatimonadales bacterium]
MTDRTDRTDRMDGTARKGGSQTRPTASRLAMVASLVVAATPLHAQAPAVATAPTLAPAPKLVMPAVETAKLANGLTLQVVPMTELPLVQATLLIDGGARLDGSHPGLATFAAGMLDEGAGGRDAFQLAAQLELLGASLSPGASWDAFTLSLRAPKRTFGDAMGILADELLRPTISSADVKRQRDLRIAALLQARDRPASVASDVFGYTVYPASHPYHYPISGDSASTVVLDSAMVRDFWRRVADPARATLILAGDISLAEAKALATKALGAWKSPASPLPLAPASSVTAATAEPTTIYLVDKPDAAQSVVMIGAPGVDRRSPDYAALTLMNTILGGSFSSRLNQILREQKGFTYGAGSDYGWRPVPGPFVASSAVRTNVTDSSLAIFFSEFKRLRSEPVTDAELARARSYVVLGTLGDFETTRQVASGLASLNVFGLPLSTIPADLERIQSLGAADVRRVAEKYLDPSHLTVVIVGDIKKIRPGIEALHLGPVKVVDDMGKETS